MEQSSPTVRSLLPGDLWRWGATATCGMAFKEDGTGEVTCSLPERDLCHLDEPNTFRKLYCGHGFSMFIAAMFEWKPLSDRDAEALDQVVDSASDIPPVEIALTLSERRVQAYQDERQTLHETYLAPEAYRMKTYTIRLEQGKFPVVGRSNGMEGLCEWYKLHFHIEPSPYPPLEEWVVKRPADIHEYWERKDFYKDTMDGDMYWDPERGVSRRGEMEQRKAEIKAKLARLKKGDSGAQGA